MNRKIALRSLKNLCAFIGAIALFSYFYNWTVDLRHWYVTLASAFACSILWLGFYLIEVHKVVPIVRAILSARWTDLQEPTESALPTAIKPEGHPF